jgi:hypothetical protein
MEEHLKKYPVLKLGYWAHSVVVNTRGFQAKDPFVEREMKQRPPSAIFG